MKPIKTSILILFVIVIFLTIYYTISKTPSTETSDLILSDFSTSIYSADEINDVFLDSYENVVNFTADELSSIEKYKNDKLKVGIPISPSFLNIIDGKYVGINEYTVLQLEKDLGIEFTHVYDTTANLYEMLDKGEIDFISGKNDTDIIRYIANTSKLKNSDQSKTYFSTNYAIYSKHKKNNVNNVSIILNSKTGVFLPYYEYINYLETQNHDSAKFQNDYVPSNDIDTLIFDDSLEYLLLPDNVYAPKYGFNQNSISDIGYTITSSFMYNRSSVNASFISAVDKTINVFKEENINEYRNGVETLKCTKGYFYTDEEIEYLKSNPTIKTEILSNNYPFSYFDEEIGKYNGKLVVILNRISSVTGLNFAIDEKSARPTLAEILQNLYSKNSDLAVGITETFNRKFYTVFSNDIYPESAILIGYDDYPTEIKDIYEAKIGVIQNSLLDEYFTTIMPTKDIYRYDGMVPAYAALQNNEIQYVASAENDLYYLINAKKDFNLKSAYRLDLTINPKFAVSDTNENDILINIIDKTLPRVDLSTVLNNKYVLTQIDSVGAYKNFLYLKIFMVSSFILIIVGIYFSIELKKSREKERNIIELNSQLNSVFLIAEFGIWSYRLDSDYIILNDVLINLFGIDENDLIIENDEKRLTLSTFYKKYMDRDVSLTPFADIVNLLSTKQLDQFRYTYKIYYCGDKSKIKYFDFLMRLDQNTPGVIFCVAKDNTKDMLYDKYESRVSATDSLTEARNRNAIYQLDVSKYLGKTVVYLDLDDFNQINNTYGHQMGDAVLNDVVSILEAYPHISEIYRMSGDEFFIILDEFNTAIAEEMVNLIRIPVRFNNYELTITCSVGIFTLKEEYGLTVEEMVNISNYAMSLAKSKGKSSYVVVDNNMFSEYRERNRLDSLLKSAINNGEIIPFFQPYIDISTKQVVGYETLMRWKTDGKILSPFSFLSIAVKSGLIYDIDLLMFIESLKFLKHLQNLGLADQNFIASSNFTSITLLRLKPSMLVDIANEIGISPKNVTIEITEQLFVDDDAFVQVSQLKRQGFKIALDDFSVGHSSMSYLKKFNVDVLKIDKSLLDDSTSSDTNLEIFRTVVNLGKSLNAKIVSEGVETINDEKVLIDTAVNIGQGYFYSKPCDKDTFVKFIEDLNAPTNEEITNNVKFPRVINKNM